MPLLTSTERRAIVTALHLAAQTYAKDARACQDAAPRIAEQFARQRAEALQLAERLETE